MRHSSKINNRSSGLLNTSYRYCSYCLTIAILRQTFMSDSSGSDEHVHYLLTDAAHITMTMGNVHTVLYVLLMHLPLTPFFCTLSNTPSSIIQSKELQFMIATSLKALYGFYFSFGKMLMILTFSHYTEASALYVASGSGVCHE